jgi:hypothetical protein
MTDFDVTQTHPREPTYLRTFIRATDNEQHRYVSEFFDQVESHLWLPDRFAVFICLTDSCAFISLTDSSRVEKFPHYARFNSDSKDDVVEFVLDQVLVQLVHKL